MKQTWVRPPLEGNWEIQRPRQTTETRNLNGRMTLNLLGLEIKTGASQEQIG